MAGDLPCNVTTLLIKAGLVEIAFEQLDERIVPVVFIGSIRIESPLAGSGVKGVGIRVGILIFRVRILLDGAGATARLLGLDLFRTHKGKQMHICVFHGDGIDIVSSKDDGRDFAGQFTKIGDDAFVISDVFIHTGISSSSLVITGMPNGASEERFAEGTLKISEVFSRSIKERSE